MEWVVIDPSKARTIIDFRRYGFEDVVVLGRYVYHSTRPPLEPHNQKDLFEFSFLAQGQQMFNVEGENFLIRGGEVIAIYPNETHGSGNYGEEKGVMYWLIIKPPRKDKIYFNTYGEEATLLWNGLNSLPNRVFRAGPNAQMYLEKIIQLATCIRPEDVVNVKKSRGNSSKNKILLTPMRSVVDSNDFIILRMRNLITTFVLEALEGSTPNYIAKSEKVQELIEFFENNLGSMMSTKEMAKLTGLSPSYLIKKFTYEVGITPGDYQLRNKVHYSLQLLDDPEYRITDITLDLGFSSSQYFATVFKRYMQMSPSEYRKRNDVH